MLRRSADCSVTVLHCVVYIMEVRIAWLKLPERDWQLQSGIKV